MIVTGKEKMFYYKYTDKTSDKTRQEICKEILHNPIIIDWECAGVANPERELLEDALCWSGFLSNNFSEEKFIAIFKEYSKYRNIEDIEWYDVICGNLVEGPYTGKNNLEFGKSLISNDAFGQVNHLIDYFPHVEGIETLFITGKLDHKWSTKLNVGEYIEKMRPDMHYLGPKSCTLYFNNACFRVEQLKNDVLFDNLQCFFCTTAEVSLYFWRKICY